MENITYNNEEPQNSVTVNISFVVPKKGKFFMGAPSGAPPTVAPRDICPPQLWSYHTLCAFCTM